MPACDEFPRPIMRSAASLDPDKAWRQLSEKSQDAPACEALANNNLPCGVNSVNLKDSLSDIHSYDCNRCHCALPPGLSQSKRLQNIFVAETGNFYSEGRWFESIWAHQ